MRIWLLRPARHALPALALVCLVAASCGEPATDPVTFESARDAAFAMEDSGGDDAAVREALLVVHAMKPEAYGVNVKLGQVCVRLGLSEEAVAAFARARATRPDEVATLRALAAQLVEIGEFERVRAILPELEVHPEQTDAVLLLKARMLDASAAGQREAEATALLNQALAVPPEEAVEALMVLGGWMLEQGAFEEARRAFLAALAEEPADTGVLKGLAAACWRMNLEDEARRWQEALELMLGLHDNVFTREQATESGRANQLSAIEHSEYIRREIEAHGERLMRLTEIHPGWAQGFLDLAQLQAERGEPKKACATVEAYLQHHGAGLSANEQQVLRNRYCR